MFLVSRFWSGEQITSAADPKFSQLGFPEGFKNEKSWARLESHFEASRSCDGCVEVEKTIAYSISGSPAAKCSASGLKIESAAMNALSKQGSYDYIMIAGPTASGKSQLAIDLALEVGGEVINADSMQLYDGL